MSDEPTTGTAITVHDERIAPRQVTLIDEWDETQRAIRTSINTTTDDGRTAYISAMTGADSEARYCLDKEIVVTGWLVHLVERVDDESGESRTGLRLVFVCQDGKTISTGSGSLIDNWAHVVRMFGQEIPFPTLVITIKAVRSRRNQGSYLQLASVRRAPVQKQAVKAKA